jgi:hypothetical protein
MSSNDFEDLCLKRQEESVGWTETAWVCGKWRHARGGLGWKRYERRVAGGGGQGGG